MTFHEYKDNFFVPCNFPIGLKKGDGSIKFCAEGATFRAEFKNGSVTMVCEEHKEELEK